MTQDEAAKVLAVISTADGGCPYCARDLLHQLHDKLPETKWLDLADGLGGDLKDIARRVREAIRDSEEMNS